VSKIQGKFVIKDIRATYFAHLTFDLIVITIPAYKSNYEAPYFKTFFSALLLHLSEFKDSPQLFVLKESGLFFQKE
jgi:hypothetical protein